MSQAILKASGSARAQPADCEAAGALGMSRRFRIVTMLAGWLLPLGAVLSGCAALPWPQAVVARGEVPIQENWLDLRGAVHVHTQASHDSPGRLSDLVAGARRAGLTWVALTEHTRPGAPPASGNRDGVVLIPGFELRARGGTLLALGLDVLPPTYRDPVRPLGAIRDAGGLA